MAAPFHDVLHHGPWYWLWLAPRWVLHAAPAATQEESLGHNELWPQLVRTAIAPHCGITSPSAIRRLSNLPYALPRGRVAQVYDLRPGIQWVFFHGQDFRMTTADQRRIARSFGLGAELKSGTAAFIHDEHERMLRADHLQFVRMVGTFPPKAARKLVFGPTL